MLRKLKKPLYSNCVILAPDGRVLCRSGERRINWYLSRGLADKISDNPATIKLNFEPGGDGDSDDPYMLASKDNRCVVCGIEEDLTRHHVVPYCYRVHFPNEAKSHTSYDVLPLCVSCHEKYELEARSLRKDILDELKIEEQHQFESIKPAVKAIKAAVALRRHGDKIPEPRRTELRESIMKYLDKTELTDEDIETAAKLEWQVVPADYACASKKVVESQSNIDAFAKRWREHFVAVMLPKFMPSYWEADKKIYESADNRT